MTYQSLRTIDSRTTAALQYARRSAVRSVGEGVEWAVNRTSDLVLGAVAIAAALAGSAVVLLLPLAAPLCGIVFAALSGAMLIWNIGEQYTARRAGAPTLIHAPWVLLALGVLVVAAWMLPLFAPLTLDSSALVALPIFLTLLAYVAYLPSTLLFWYADDAGLTRQVLAFRRTLPWQTIDWVYGAQQATTQQVYSAVTVAKWTDRVLIVEAGPERSLRVLLASLLVGGDAQPLLAAIQSRATRARFGFDQMPAVLRARGDMRTGTGTRPGTGQPPAQPIAASDATLADAIRQARSGAVPAGWTLFSVRPAAVWSNLAAGVVLGVGLIAAMGYLFLSGKAIVPGFIPDAWLGPRTALIVGLVELALAVIAGVALIVVALRWTRALSHPNDYFFLITPRYFAAVRGPKVRAAAIADVRRIVTESGFYGLQISVQLRSGQKVTFDFGKIFGPPRTIYGYLQSALSASTVASPPRHQSSGAALEVTYEAEG